MVAPLDFSTEAAPPSSVLSEQQLANLRDLRAEAQELQVILESVEKGEAILSVYAEYIQQTKTDISQLLSSINDGDSIRHLQNIWEQMNANPLLENPQGEFDAREQLQHLNLLKDRIRKLIFRVGTLTIPARVNSWLQGARSGYFIPFHLVFEDEMPSYEDRVRVLQYLAWTPEAVKGGLVDATAGVIYRYSEKKTDRIRSLVIVLIAFFLATAAVFGSAYLAVSGWPIQPTHVPNLLINPMCK
jgi:hypothetical protein